MSSTKTSTSSSKRPRAEEEDDPEEDEVGEEDDEEESLPPPPQQQQQQRPTTASSISASTSTMSSSGAASKTSSSSGSAAAGAAAGGGGSSTNAGTSSGNATTTTTTTSSSSSMMGPSSKYNYAVVCSSNVNRSMEAHVAFFNNKLRVGSYGAGRFVRLPVPGSIEGKSFEFGTPYDSMLSEFVAQADAKTQDFYRRTKLLDILRRNGQIKVAPERWQDASFEEVAGYDVVVCFEQRIFDAVCEDLQSREARDLEPICVICMETKDDPKEAVVAGKATVKLAQKLEESDDLATDAPDIVETFVQEEGRRLLFQICYL